MSSAHFDVRAKRGGHGQLYFSLINILFTWKKKTYVRNKFLVYVFEKHSSRTFLAVQW